jgi:abequosyltransferase
MTQEFIKGNSAQPLLTLAIPTFNRLGCLRLLVDSIINQISNEGLLGQAFELLICNNASTDGTTEYLNELKNANAIRVIHHASNCGADNNIIQCFESAKGKFVWVVGDDDVLLVGAINAVMENIEQKSPALMYLPSMWVAGDLSKAAKNPISSTKVKCMSSIILAVQSSVYITFISSWVINKELYLSQSNFKIDRYRNSFLAQLEWHFTLLANGNKFLSAEDNWIIARAGSSGGYSVFETFSQQYNRIVDEKFPSNSNLHRFFRSNMLWCFIPGLVWGVRKNAIGNFGEFEEEKIRGILKSAFENDLYFSLIVAPIIFLKKPLALIFWFFARLLAKLRMKYWRVISLCK